MDYRKLNKEPTHRIRFPSAFDELTDLKVRVELLERYLKDETDTVYEITTLEQLDELVKDIREQMTKQPTVRVTLER
jgi:hypothetical protein